MANVIKSDLPDLHLPEISIADFILGKVYSAKDKNMPGLIDRASGEVFTYGSLQGAITEMADYLHKQGLRTGDVISIFAQNSARHSVVALAVMELGCTLALINYMLTEDDIYKYVCENESKFLVVDKATENKMTVIQNKSTRIKKIFSIHESLKHSVLPFNDLTSSPPRQRSENRCLTIEPKKDISCIMYSSGSTGRPKGVLITHFTHTAELMILAKNRLFIGNTNLIFQPFSHVFGYFFYLNGLYLNIPCVIYDRFDLGNFLEDIERYQVDMLGLVPPLVVYMIKSPLTLKYNLSSVRDVICGAAPLKGETEEEFMRILPQAKIRQVYGMTELSGGVVAHCGDIPPRKDSVGILLNNCEMKVIDTDGNSLGPGQTGELVFRSPLTMKGYLKQPEDTAATLDAEGWIYTGDVGHYDEDKYVYVTDRIKDLIKYNALQVAPSELDAVILEHPDVSDAAVVGVPNETTGEIPMAFVVVKTGHTLTDTDLMAFVAGRVAPFKKIRAVKFVESIPKNPSGKILRRVLREMY